MKRYIILAGLAALGLTSCKKFLQEEPRSSLTAPLFYDTPNQIQTAVDGSYVGLETPYTSVFLGLPVSEYWSFESLTAFSVNPFGTGPDEQTYVNLDVVDPRNGYLLSAYQSVYTPLKAINLSISKIQATSVIDESTKNRYLAQLRFLRAWHYFHGVRTFGEMPLITEPIAGIKDEQTQFPKATIDKIYAQIETDLTSAETAAEAGGLPWVDGSGHVTTAAIKSLLAEVYITMAGYPLQKGTEYYNKAYQKAKEVIDEAPGKGIHLFATYAELRNPGNDNTGEHIFQAQRSTDPAFRNELVIGMVPLSPPINDNIAKNIVFDPALVPTREFYNSYNDNDLRKKDSVFFWNREITVNNNTTSQLINYKFWDDAAINTPGASSGLNIWLIRYAQVLLTCAEAKARADGGSTSDATAVKAYNDVHTRAIPGDTKGTISSDDVMKERFHELAYEYISWYDMQRTRETYDLVNNQIVPLIGFKAVSHKRPYNESDLLQPLPTQARLVNPRLNDPAE